MNISGIIEYRRMEITSTKMILKFSRITFMKMLYLHFQSEKVEAFILFVLKLASICKHKSKWRQINESHICLPQCCIEIVLHKSMYLFKLQFPHYLGAQLYALFL